MGKEDISIPTHDNAGAIDPDTGEINWDCPCLADALKPPCGEFFKTAFSCFIKSTSEPKGEDCLSAFVAMRECFLRHPEIYAPVDTDTDTKQSHLSETAKVESTGPTSRRDKV